MSTLKPLIVILGPTASGKSELAIDLAHKFNGEIISADSRQIYRGMDIGTGKYPRTETLDLKYAVSSPDAKITSARPLLIGGIQNYFIDIANPDQDFTLAQFKKAAIYKINEIHSRGKLPFLVGGTGLYISSIVDNLKIPKAAPNEKLREKLEKMTTPEMAANLKKLDIDAYQTIDKKNRRRLIRALEVILSTGKTFSSQKSKGKPLFDTLEIGIETRREELYRKIEDRIDKMIKLGLEEEVRNLLDAGYSRNLPSMSGIGYKQMIMYLNEEISFKEAIRLIKRDTRRYARRQMTWFRRNKNIHWIKNNDEAKNLIKNFLSKKILE